MLRWWMWALISAATGFASAYGVAHSGFLPGHPDATAKQMFTVFIGLIFAIAAVAIFPPRIVRPYRMKILDRHRRVLRMKFENAAYTKMLAAQIRRVADEVSAPTAT